MSKFEEDFQELFDLVIEGHFAEAQGKLITYSDVNFKNSAKSTLLMTACQSTANKNEILRFVHFLLHKGAYIMTKDASGKTAIDYCEQNELFQVKMLLCQTMDFIIAENIFKTF